ncbi:TniQ family protein [Aliiroseovarius crassostreae]|uniref:TniQ family protein n=1 Tax=Aliiroseovarius crassostreae TaxID=154981 RepID=UPI002204C9A8|nr:TniQ family protein [Aliiroseovarius crassostreae]UWP97796.1 TniQ family protein [Aliiroseovarius crassostreae]
MTRVLTPHLPIEAGESAVSWACRLALFHTGEPLVKLLNDLAIPLPSLVAGKPEALGSLALSTGIERQVLVRHQPQQLANRLYRLRGEVFSTSFMGGTRTAFCAHCIAENDASTTRLRVGYWRWLLRSVRTCERHGTALSFLPKIVWSDQIHDLNRMAPRGEELERMVRDVVRRGPSPLQTYILRRLHDKQDEATWLNSQSMEQGARACEMLGVLIGWGAKPDLNRLSEDDWDRAGRLGFEIASKGEEEIYGFFRQVLAEFPDRSARNGAQAVFGRLFQWLQFNRTKRDPGPIRGLLRNFIVEEMAVSPGKLLLGEVVETRKRHSAKSLADQYNLHPKTMHRALVASGLSLARNPDQITGLEFCDAAKGEALAQAMVRGIPVNALPKAMNATRGQIEMLMDQGFLSSILPKGSVRSKTLNCVDKQLVDAFLDSIVKQARLVDVATLGVLSIPKAAEAARRLSADIVRLLLDGKLKSVERVNGTSGYLSVLVDPLEIKAQLPIEKVELPPTKTDAAPILGVTPTALNVLLEGVGGLPLLRAIDDDRPGPAQKRIEWNEIQRFKHRYITLGELKQITGTHHTQVQRELEAICVRPVRDPKILKVHLFEREEALRIIS